MSQSQAPSPSPNTMHPGGHAPLTGSQRIFVLLCVSVPSFMINIDANIVAVSLPSIARSFHADFAAVEWVISAYTLTFASLVMPSGSLADRFGRRRVLMAGIAVFTAASFICGAATSVAVLIAARALQGVGAAMQLSSALAILSHSFRGRERAAAFSFWGSLIGVAITMGPVAGGWITEEFGWEWAFYVNVPVGVAIAVLTFLRVEESGDPNATGLDIPGIATFSLGLFLLTLGLISGNRTGWASHSVLGEICSAVALFAAFVVVEASRPRPMLDLRFFRLPTFVGATLASFAFAACFLTMLTYLPLYFQGGLGASPIRAGLLMLPMAVPLFVVPRIVSRHVVHVMSGRALLTIGLGLVTAGLFWMGMHAPAMAYGSLLPGMLVAGCGAGILNGEVAKVSMTVIPPERAGMASGVGGTVRFSGIVVGFAALGTVLYQRISRRIGETLVGGHGQTADAMARHVAAGNLRGGRPLEDALAMAAFGAGYQALLMAAAIVAGLSTVVTWLCVRQVDTPPIGRAQPENEEPVLVLD